MFSFFFKQKTAYEMRISDWSSDVCSSDLCARCDWYRPPSPRVRGRASQPASAATTTRTGVACRVRVLRELAPAPSTGAAPPGAWACLPEPDRSPGIRLTTHWSRRLPSAGIGSPGQRAVHAKCGAHLQLEIRHCRMHRP